MKSTALERHPSPPGNFSFRSRLFFEVHSPKVCGKGCGRRMGQFTHGKGFKVAIVPSRSTLPVLGRCGSCVWTVSVSALRLWQESLLYS